MKDWTNIKYFASYEFDSPDKPGSGSGMDIHFISVLDALRAKCGFPFSITSGFRTPEHNLRVGGHPNSAHLWGLAADIRAADSRSRLLIIYNALLLGVRRIGVGSTFIHLDMDPSLPQDVMWLYPAGCNKG